MTESVQAIQGDRRVAQRFSIGVSMLAAWRDDRNHELKVVSRDMSDSGIYFFAKLEIPIGTTIELTFTMPADPGQSETQRFRKAGTVVRVDGVGEKEGYGVRITSSELVSQPSRAVLGPIGTPVASPTQEHPWRRPILVLVILAVVASVVAIVVAVTTSRNSATANTSSAENVEVWTDDHTGRYFCPDSAWYGKTREGRYLTQKEARFAGFRPIDGEPCFGARLSR
jgi:hypothetical protein